MSQRPGRFRTIIVALGPDALLPGNTDTLNQMAAAGGFARQCPMGTDAECGAADTCNATTRTCNRAFFAAADAQQLTQQLVQMTTPIQNTNVCTVPLVRTPASLDQFEVTVDQAPLARCADATGCNTWTFDAANDTVVFQGATCARLQNATPQQPVELTFKFFFD